MIDKFTLPLIGVAIGVLAGFVVAPTPPTSEHCEVYKVAPKVVTSFVLKPPPAPAATPIVVKEKCPAPEADSQKLTDEKSETIEPENPRRHRRWRHRRYWRRHYG